MHLGLIAEHSDPARGGAERYLHGLVDRLRRSGHTVSTCSRTGPWARRVPSRPAALRPLFYAQSFLPWLRERGAERVLATQPVPGCDFYQPHMGILGASLPCRLEASPSWLRALRRANPVRAAHFAVLKRFESRAVAPPARVLALSPRVADDLKRLHPRAAPALLLRPGVDLERFRPGDAAERRSARHAFGLGDGPLLLFCARNFALKGLATAIRATAELDDCTLAVAGGDREAPFRRLARACGAETRILFLDEVRDLPALLRSADLLCQPTFYDTASRIVLEALASGVAPVTTVRDGNGDLAAAGGGAALPDPRDSAALAACVRRLLAVDPGTRAGQARATAAGHPESARLDAVVEAVTCVSSC